MSIAPGFAVDEIVSFFFVSFRRYRECVLSLKVGVRAGGPRRTERSEGGEVLPSKQPTRIFWLIG